MKTKKIKINGLNQQLYLWGNPKKPKLFLFHGWLDTGASFDFICRYLKDDFYCIAPDFRGYGKSEHTKNALGYFFYEYVADVYALIHQLAPKGKIRILGHSLGGAVASIYAGAYPKKVSHFINVEGFGFQNTPMTHGPERFRKWIEGIHTKRFMIHKNIRAFARRLQKSNPRLTETRALFLAKYVIKRTKGGIVMAADTKHKMMEPYWFPVELFQVFWRKIQAKCLLVTAEKTEMSQRFKGIDFKKEMKRRFRYFPKKSKKVIIKNCGHMVHHEKPEELTKVVKPFLVPR